jgi:hypothetical protein
MGVFDFPSPEIPMSYSIGVVAATLSAAREALAAKFDEIVMKPQPVHAKDREQALAAADAFLSLLGDKPEDHDVSVSLSGSLTWRGAEQSDFCWANVSVSCGYTLRKVQQPA